MKQNIDLETQRIPEIMSFFNLGTPLSTTRIKDGIANHNYLVNSPQGEYVVKFLVTQTVENIENDVAIQKQLKQAVINTPEYLQNNNGLYIFSSDNIKATVSLKIDGVIPRKVNARLAKEFGQKLATFHKYVTQLPHPNNKGLMNPEVSSIPSDIFLHSLPRGIIHGDFHLGNVLVAPQNQDSIVAILDFEEAGGNLYLVDLAVTIMGVCFSSDENAMDPILTKETIKGYQSVRKLDDDEKTLFSEAVRYSAETWIKWFKDNGYEKYAIKHKNRLHSFMELSSKLVLFDN